MNYKLINQVGQSLNTIVGLQTDHGMELVQGRIQALGDTALILLAGVLYTEQFVHAELLDAIDAEVAARSLSLDETKIIIMAHQTPKPIMPDEAPEFRDDDQAVLNAIEEQAMMNGCKGFM